MKLFCATSLSIVLLLRSANLTFAEENNASPADIPVFSQEAKVAGIEHKYEGPWEYYVGGGAAGFDCNGDRVPDLAIAGGTSPAKIYTNRSEAGGSLKFTQKLGALPQAVSKNVTGFYPIDISGDGYKDLIVLRVGKNYLLEGGPDCSFTVANTKYGFDGGREWTTAFSAKFEAGQHLPTMAFGNYVDRSAPGSPWGTCHDNFLFRQTKNDAVRYSKPQILTPGYCALSMLFTDWSNTARKDLRITNDRQYYRGGQEQLWRVSPGKPARAYRSADGWKKVLIWGMGIAETDLDGDGLPEYALTSMGDTKLQKLNSEEDPPRPVYRDIAFEKGATAHRPYTGGELKPSTGWHAEFSDFNNDGRSDLFIAKGNVEAMPDFASFDPDNMLLMQADGRFVETGGLSGIAQPTRGRGAVLADFNMDGLMDLAVVNRDAPATLFRNLGTNIDGALVPMGNWIQIELQQQSPNRDAIGATISIKTGNKVQTRTIQTGGGHASGKLGFVHFGLGVAERATIRIKWPDGSWSHEYRVFANNFVVIERSSQKAKYWYPVASK